VPTDARPKEVGWWIKRNRLFTKLPVIEDCLEFEVAWMEWWVQMQPPWRNGEALDRMAPADADWEPIFRGGPIGFALVVAALSWWVSEVTEEGLDASGLMGAIDDVNWVVSKLLGVLSPAKKHSLDESSRDEPASKRCVIISLYFIIISNKKLAELKLLTNMPLFTNLNF
jgi:hypothetical protein